MKNRKVLTTLIILICFSKLSIYADEPFSITSSGIKDGIIDEKYGINGPYKKDGIPFYSLPITIHNPPSNSKSFVVAIVDLDAVVPTGFVWVHWTVANITKLSLAENESRTNLNLVQGINSWNSPLLKSPISKKEASFYGGMSPPDKPHEYTIVCYALDCILDIENGFFINDLYKKMQGHIISKANMVGIYPKKVN